MRVSVDVDVEKFRAAMSGMRSAMRTAVPEALNKAGQIGRAHV